MRTLLLENRSQRVVLIQRIHMNTKNTEVKTVDVLARGDDVGGQPQRRRKNPCLSRSAASGHADSGGDEEN